jgi:Asp-tRNA(Asn)/Glu-tRNA(Gln) amidotransferase A subunit family amidase
MCPLALGSQTIGSVIRPASFCGVVGFKPSYGRIPLDGVVPVSPSLDHVGLFTQDVAGAAAAAPVCVDDWDDLADTDRPVLGVPDGDYLGQADDATFDHFEAVVEDLAGAGYEVRHVAAFAGIEAVNEHHDRLVPAEMALAHEEWFESYGDRYGSVTTDYIERGQEVSVAELAAARRGRLELRAALHDRMAEQGVDVWLSPAAPGPAPSGIDDTGDPVMNLPWTHAGVPAVSLPAGRVDGLPVGLQCTARFGDDERLLAWAAGIENALDG